MFDDQNTVGQAPQNLPTEPADIFAGVDKSSAAPPVAPGAPKDALGAGLLRKAPSSDTMANMPVSAQAVYNVKEPVIGKILLILIVIAALVGAGIGGWMLYKYFTAPTVPTVPTVNTPATNNTPASENLGNTPVSEEPASVTPTNTAVTPVSVPTSSVSVDMANDKLLFGEAIDSDRDGLDDTREKQLGTDIGKTDTDGDGLSDADEVIIWKTDPLNPDTDGDKYPDGTEVRNGYNPLGPGKLFVTSGAVSTSTKNTSTTTTNTTK